VLLSKGWAYMHKKHNAGHSSAGESVMECVYKLTSFYALLRERNDGMCIAELMRMPVLLCH
jgi:hypothetical protein